jgi:hypothetical protein
MMMGFLSKIRAALTWLAGLVHPALAMAGGLRQQTTALYFVLHAVVLVAILVGLWYVQHQYLREFFGSWLKVPFLQAAWLPLFVLLLYALGWALWWAWPLLFPQEEESHFPDIDAAWNEAVMALHRAGIHASDPPLFLVLGRAEDNEEALFQAAAIPLAVKRTPAGRGAPLHVYANREGIYVTCPGASLMGRQAAILSGAVEFAGPTETEEGGRALPLTDVFDPNATMKPQGKALDVQAILTRAREQGRTPQQLTDEEKEEIRLMLLEEKAEQALRKGRARTHLWKDPAERERLSARLRHLCRLIASSRRPYCPVNGILLVVPLGATESDEDANQTGRLCQEDLRSARQSFQIQCPVIALLGDLENLPGGCFREFVERFPESQRGRRVGQRFPLVPDADLATVDTKIGAAAEWVCDTLVPGWIYKLFRVDRPGSDSLENAVRGNARLFQLMYQMWERQQRLGLLLRKAIMTEQGGPMMFGGCYVGGAGRDGREQAFIAGVFQRLTMDQDAVSWTDEAAREEANYRRLTYIGYVSLAVGLIVAALVIYVLLTR